MAKKYFWGKKYVLSSGREVDLSCEEEAEGIISMLAILNHLDAVHETTKPISVRLEWRKAQNDPFLSIECRGGTPGQGRPISESELPIEGLNGQQDKLKLSEFVELFEVMKSFYSRIVPSLSR